MKIRNIKYITIDDVEYPDSLRDIYDPPQVLFYFGNIELLNSDNMKFAIVGSRKGGDYGHNVTKYFSKSLAEKGVIIVSGLAKNIDSYAHRYCIEGKSKTIAVLGTQIDRIYPKSNSRLAKEIIDTGGLIISEYNFNAVTKPFNFAIRNRIISGISEGVLVTEAEEKSGTLITIDCALQQGKNVYAVPGSIFSTLSKGCNNAISQGAKPVQNVEDILEDYEIIYKFNKIFSENSRNNISNYVNIVLGNYKDVDLSEKEMIIMDLLLKKGAVDVEKIIELTALKVSDVSFCIEKLSMLDLVVEQGINVYAPNIK